MYHISISSYLFICFEDEWTENHATEILYNVILYIKQKEW